MAISALRSLWAEPRPTNATDPGPRDWALVAALVGWSLVEVVLRRDLAPGPVLLLYALAVIGPLPMPPGPVTVISRVPASVSIPARADRSPSRPSRASDGSGSRWCRAAVRSGGNCVR